MTAVLITGFGPFPGAPFNPTEPLVRELVRRRHPGNLRCAAHIFDVTYDAVDRELPELIEREEPDALIMFGLAMRTDHVRIETRARNSISRTLPDARGYQPVNLTIDVQAPAVLPLRTPAQRLLRAARAAQVPAALSTDAGRYLCNYLSWRAAECARRGTVRVTSFIHVPPVGRSSSPRKHRLTLDDLIAAGEAIMRAAALAARY
ncbi:MAG: pyroglutamyl-peptidase I [Xanthobacteraceae bacterium]